MSRSGGYFKYRCKYWFTHNCQNWVWVHNAPCAYCLADGRDSKMAAKAPLRLSREVSVPQFEDGKLRYALVEDMAEGDWDSGWAIKQPTAEPFPSVTGPSATTTSTAITAIDGGETQKAEKIGIHHPVAGQNGMGNKDHLE